MYAERVRAKDKAVTVPLRAPRDRKPWTCCESLILRATMQVDSAIRQQEYQEASFG